MVLLVNIMFSKIRFLVCWQLLLLMKCPFPTCTFSKTSVYASLFFDRSPP